MYKLIAEPNDFGCQVPCKEKSYNFNVKYFHESSWIDYDGTLHQRTYNFILFYFYHSLDVEESFETYLYDLSNFLAEGGGNLGLTLGISCFSVLFGIVKFVYNLA
jgi:hypothetical protein